MMNQFTTRQLFLALAFFAAVLSASGFVLEYGFGVLPCQMCWWQRYAHYVIFAFSLLGAFSRWPRYHAASVMVVALAGLSIALWQFAAQHGWLPFPASCGADATQAFASADDLLTAMNNTRVIPCDRENFKLLGLSLAGWNIPAMLLIAALSVRALLQPVIK